MAGGEADDLALAAHRLAGQQGMGGGAIGRLWQQGGEIVVKDKGGGVSWVLLAIGAGIASAQIAGGVVRGAVVGGRFFNLPLPRPRHAVGGNEDVFACKGVIATVGREHGILDGGFWILD